MRDQSNTSGQQARLGLKIHGDDVPTKDAATTTAWSALVCHIACHACTTKGMFVVICTSGEFDTGLFCLLDRLFGSSAASCILQGRSRHTCTTCNAPSCRTARPPTYAATRTCPTAARASTIVETAWVAHSAVCSVWAVPRTAMCAPAVALAVAAENNQPQRDAMREMGLQILRAFRNEHKDQALLAEAVFFYF